MPTSKKSHIGGKPTAAAKPLSAKETAARARNEEALAIVAQEARKVAAKWPKPVAVAGPRKGSAAYVDEANKRARALVAARPPKTIPKSVPAAKVAAAKAKSEEAAAELEESAETKAKKLGLKIPKKLAEVADLFFKTRNDRLALDKQAEAMKAREEALKEHLINQLPKLESTGIAGKLCRVTLGSKEIPVAKNWDDVWRYIVKNYKKNPGVVALVQKRLGEATVKEMWEAGKDVPGVEHFTVKTLGVNKL